MKKSLHLFLTALSLLIFNFSRAGAAFRLATKESFTRVEKSSVWDINKDTIADSYFFLQNLIDSHYGKEVVLPKGVYYVSNTLHIPPNTKLIGNHSKIYTNHPDTIIVIDGSNVTVDGIELQGIGNKEISYHNIGICHTYNPKNEDSNITISNCKIHDMGNFGIYLINTNGVNISNTTIRNVGYAGISINSCRNVNITKCTISTVIPNKAGDAYGVAFSVCKISNHSFLTPTRNSVIQHCVIKNIPKWHGIDCHSGINIEITDNYIDSCFVGIYLTAFGNYINNSHVPDTVLNASSGCNIIGNIVDGKGLGNGIVIYGGSESNLAENNIISNNTILNCGMEANYLGGGIAVYRTKNLRVSSNTIENSITNGIAVAFSNYNIDITNNSIKNIFGRTPTSAINVNGESNTGKIESNSIYSDANVNENDNRYGISIKKGKNNSINIVGNAINNVKTKLNL